MSLHDALGRAMETTAISDATGTEMPSVNDTEIDKEPKNRLSKWDDRYLRLADHIRKWPKDPNGKVGAVITSPSLGRVISLGFNGFPINVADSAERLGNKEEKLEMVIHAEQNAMLFAGRSARDCHMYVVGKPVCNFCAVMIIQAGITRVISAAPRGNTESQWDKRAVLSAKLFAEANVIMDPIPEEILRELLGNDY